MVEALSIELCDVLYRTRGHDWDYAFLLQPEPLLSEGWYALHRKIFANVEPGRAAQLLRGALGVGTGHAFFATTFTDDVRRDDQARPIAHYLVWFGRAAEAAPGWSFGPGLVEQLGPALDAVFRLTPSTLGHNAREPLDALLQRRFAASLKKRVVEVACAPGAPLRWLGTLAP